MEQRNKFKGLLAETFKFLPVNSFRVGPERKNFKGMAVAYRDGHVLWIPTTTITATCLSDGNFPHDTQVINYLIILLLIKLYYSILFICIVICAKILCIILI